MTTGAEDHQDEQYQALRARLRALDPPAVPPGFFDRALEKARHEGERRQREKRRWLMTGFGSAIAAGLAIVAIAGLLLHNPDSTVEQPLPVVTIALAEEKTVRLVFSSEVALDAATLSLTLPRGIELAGFPGQQQLEWVTSLEAGRNLLPLTLRATAAAGGEIVATLEHDARQRTYRLKVEIA